MRHCNHHAYHLSAQNEEYCIGYRNHLFCKVWSDFTLFCFRGKNIFIWLIRANNCLWWPCCSSDKNEMRNSHRHHPKVFRQDLFQFGSDVSSIISSTYVCTLQADIKLKLNQRYGSVFQRRYKWPSRYIWIIYICFSCLKKFNVGA